MSNIGVFSEYIPELFLKCLGPRCLLCCYHWLHWGDTAGIVHMPSAFTVTDSAKIAFAQRLIDIVLKTVIFFNAHFNVCNGSQVQK